MKTIWTCDGCHNCAVISGGMYLPEVYANATWLGLWTDLSLENQNDTGLPMMNSPAWPLGEQSKDGVRYLVAWLVGILSKKVAGIGCLNVMIVVILGTPLYPDGGGGAN